MKRDTLSKIMAIFALIWITIWIIWTWLMVILWWDSRTWSETTKQVTKEDLQKMIDEWKVKVSTDSWASESWNTNTWIIENLINQTWALEKKIEETLTWKLEVKSESWNEK